jgi:hypothetical protein
MKNLSYDILAFTLLRISNAKWLNKSDNNNILSISSGSVFLLCRGYCQSSINISSTPPRLIVSKEPLHKRREYPPKQRSFPFSSSQWEELVNLVDLEKFKSLGDDVDCGSSCITDWSQWIQIDWINGSKKIRFNAIPIPGFETLANKLDEIMKQYEIFKPTFSNFD